MITNTQIWSTMGQVANYLYHAQTAMKIQRLEPPNFKIHVSDKTFRDMYLECTYEMDVSSRSEPTFMGYPVVHDITVPDGSIKVTTEEVFR